MGATIAVHTVPCPHCGRRGLLEVSAPGLVAYRAGALVQDAFPELSADQREQLVTGLHPACWDAAVGPDDDETCAGCGEAPGACECPL